MKKRILWLGLSLLLVAPFVLTGRPAAEERVATVEGEPQYGGELTVITRNAHLEISTLDMSRGNWAMEPYANPYLQRVVRGDEEKYGPRGLDVYSFECDEDGSLEQFMRGELAESWELTDEAIVFHMRKGVMFTGNARIGMEPREMTAHDLVATWERWLASPVGKGASGWLIKNVYARDDYTVILEWDGYDYVWAFWAGGGSGGIGVTPPEVIAAGEGDWRNQSGTGPFIIQNYVPGSYIVYERNPNYWETTTIDGVEYQLPFIDTLVYPIIPDMSTQIAAVRTATADFMRPRLLEHWDTLARTSPDLILKQVARGGHQQVAFQCGPDSGSIFVDNVDLRRAIAIGTDQKAFGDTLYGEGNYILNAAWQPIGGMFNVPVEDMRESARIIYEYNPELAKQMLADAGYPDGLKFEMICGTEPERSDGAAILKEQWSRIGIDVTLRVVEPTVYSGLRARPDYPEVFLHGDGDSKRQLMHLMSWYPARSRIYDPVREAKFREAGSVQDLEKQAALMNDLTQYIIETVDHIRLPSPLQMTAWWPWVKNYYGEQNTGYANAVPFIARMWIDQDLKRSMGF